MLLIGCSGPSRSAGAIVAKAVDGSGAPLLSVGLVMVDPALAPTAVGAAELIEMGTCQYATGLAGRFLVWLYADPPVASETVNIGCGGNIVVDVALSTGWNVAARTFDAGLDRPVVGEALNPGEPIITLFPPSVP